MKVFGLMWQSVNLLWKTAGYNVAYVYTYFCGGKNNNNFVYNFVTPLTVPKTSTQVYKFLDPLSCRKEF